MVQSGENASLPRRLGAILYDSLLIIALLALVTTFFLIFRGGVAVQPYTPTHQLTLLVTIYFFFVGFWSRAGRTLGMQAWRLRLETPGGNRPSVSSASLRFAAAILSFVLFGLGFFWQLWDKDRLTWHDRISGTRLVYYPRKKQVNEPD